LNRIRTCGFPPVFSLPWQKLRTLKLDDNQITSIGTWLAAAGRCRSNWNFYLALFSQSWTGYREIAAGVAASSGLRALPLPLTDVLAAARVAPAETGKALVSIGVRLACQISYCSS
jgi:hypothetical protein